MFDVTMPQLGETVAEGTVTKWFKSVGDEITKGEALFEVSTDKVDTEIPSPSSGRLTAILVPEGQTVDVGTPLATIDAGDTPATNTPATNTPATNTPATNTSAPTAPRVTETRASGGHDRLSPVVRRLLDERGLSPEQVTGTGPGGRITRDDVLAAATVAAPTPSISAGTAGLSPVVRRLLDERGLSPEQVTGTGPGGRITRRDVETHVPTTVGTGTNPERLSGDEVIPFTKTRRLTAEHMRRSKDTSAHTLMVREIDFERVEIVRRRDGTDFKNREGFALTYLPFVAVALTRAIRAFPHLNASVGDDELIIHHDLNVGIAVDLDGSGLVVPVVHGADQLSLRDMARRIRELATGARTKKLTVDDMSRGTITITNPGPYGTLMTGAIINQPQVAIVATDGVKRKPVVITTDEGEESIAIHSVGLIALTFDHRAIDGAYAAQFLARLDDELNRRDWSLDA